MAGPSRLRAADGKEDHANQRGAALLSRSSSSLLLARAKDEGVSGTKQAPGGAGPSTTGPLPRSPSEGGNKPSVNAPGALHLQDAADASPAHSYGQPSSPHTPVSAPASPKPLSRRTNFVTVHPDKTFSLVQLRPVSTATTSEVSGSLRSPPLSALSHYSSRTSSSHDHPSIDVWSDDRPSSPTFTGTSATIPDFSLTELSSISPSPGSSTVQLAEDPITASPWNYGLVGGLRKVPKTPDPKHKKFPLYDDTPTAAPSPSSPADTLAPLPEITIHRHEEATPSPDIGAQGIVRLDKHRLDHFRDHQLQSIRPFPSPRVQREPCAAFVAQRAQLRDHRRVVASRSCPKQPGGLVRQQRELYFTWRAVPIARSSGRRPPATATPELFPGEPRRPALESPSVQKAIQREVWLLQAPISGESPRTGRVHQVDQGISSILTTQDISHAFVANPVFLDLRGRADSPHRRRGRRRRPRHRRFLRAGQPMVVCPTGRRIIDRRPLLVLAPAPCGSDGRVPPRIWSSQLSTVMSESEEDSLRAPSRSVSPSAGHGAHRRRSSAGWASSMHSRQLPSISSSLAGQLEEVPSGSRGSGSQSESLERPRPTVSRTGLSQSPNSTRPGRARRRHRGSACHVQPAIEIGLSGFFSSSNSSSRNLHSSASSRANSFSSASIPAWAR